MCRSPKNTGSFSITSGGSSLLTSSIASLENRVRKLECLLGILSPRVSGETLIQEHLPPDALPSHHSPVLRAPLLSKDDKVFLLETAPNWRDLLSFTIPFSPHASHSCSDLSSTLQSNNNDW